MLYAVLKRAGDADDRPGARVPGLGFVWSL